jgi:hypothetical protein
MSSRSKDEKKINYAEPASDVDDTELLEAQGATSAADDDTRRKIHASRLPERVTDTQQPQNDAK